MNAFDTATLRPVEKVERISESLAASWARRAPWTRTCTSRWLNDRADAVNAATLRTGLAPTMRSDGKRHMLPKSPGDALRVNNRGAFDRIHTRLAALADDTAREAALVPEIVR
jgi:hypothetical protein